MERILITGAAGFIGFHLAKQLLDAGYEISGIDNLNNYYDVSLKNARLNILKKYDNFTFDKVELADRTEIDKIFTTKSPDVVVNLAAQAGVRYSIENPYAYLDSNLSGFLNILEGCRNYNVKHLVYASSSSVYGANTRMPFSTHQTVDHPLSLYAATKKSNELMAHTYSNLYDIPTTGLRFFTVYGPWGRPDMAMFLFTKAILSNQPIDVFNHGDMERDFTYIDDIVNGIEKILFRIPEANPGWSGNAPDPASSFSRYKIYNIGNNKPEKLSYLIMLLEKYLGKKAIINYLPMQPGDVKATFADIDDLVNDAGFRPSTALEEGVKKFVDWYKKFYKIN
ncbi:MAG: NAD-dependent epimerase [Calditrichaceae bacterium]